MRDFKIKTLVLGMMQTNCYLISNEENKQAIVIDPADNAVKIEEYLQSNDLVCKGILLTHGHFDHIMAASELAEFTHADLYANEAEAELLNNAAMNLSTQFYRECTLIPDNLLKDQEELHLAGFKITVIHTPGHTAGGTSYYFGDQGVLFSGDSLFRESIGRTDFPTGNGKLLIKSIVNKLMILDDQVKVYPGHGIPTSIGYERVNNYNLSEYPDF